MGAENSSKLRVALTVEKSNTSYSLQYLLEVFHYVDVARMYVDLPDSKHVDSLLAKNHSKVRERPSTAPLSWRPSFCLVITGPARLRNRLVGYSQALVIPDDQDKSL